VISYQLSLICYQIVLRLPGLSPRKAPTGRY